MLACRLFQSMAIICLAFFSLPSCALVAGEGDKSSLTKTSINPKLPEMSGKIEIEVRDSADKLA